MNKIKSRTRAISSLLVLVTVMTFTTPVQAYAADMNTQTAAYSVTSVGDVEIIHLRDDAICGMTGNGNEYIPYEAFGGLRVHCEGTTVSYEMYAHNSNYNTGTIYVERSYPRNDAGIEIGTVNAKETGSFDINDISSQMDNDHEDEELYNINIVSGKNNNEIAKIFLYYDGEKVQTCKVRKYSNKTMKKWGDVVGRLDPSTCLDMYVGNPGVPITYPTSGTDGNCNHVDELCALSDEIILFDDWNDQAKVFATVLYLTRNYAYDNYRVRTCNNVSRATKANCWTDDNLFMYGNHVGQCWDFANAMVIMLRHQGIPCTTVENSGHTFNAVWLEDEWVAIDVSVLALYHCDTKDTAKENWIRYPSVNFDDNYGFYADYIDTYNQSIATPETTLYGRSGKNPI